MKAGDIIQLVNGNSFYNKYLGCYGIILDVYLTDEGKEISDIRFTFLKVDMHGNEYIAHQHEKAYLFRLKVIS